MTLNAQILTGTGSSVVNALAGLTAEAQKNVNSVLRIVGDFQYRINTANAEHGGRLGFIVVSNDSLAGLTTPDPQGDPSADWLYNTGWWVDDATLRMHRIPIDTKGSRRIPGADHTLAFVIEGNIASNITNWGIDVRLLYSYK